MGFATTWLNQRALFPELIKEAPDNQTGIVVVVPAFDESSISILLNSLNSCVEPQCSTEVLVIVNAPANASDNSLRNNKQCISEINSWKKNHESFFRLFVFDTGQSPVKGWGVGLARKTGMDEAVRRFNFLDKAEGVIVCLDADCTVERNYFTTICNEFLAKKERSACSIYFEHALSGADFQSRIYRYIVQYELHLRYFLQGLKYSGYPYAFHTIGSSLAVKALWYVKAGGMNRRQAGEDFYFVQKLISMGGYFAMNTTTVYPSPRESYRVPFGTGATMSKLMYEREEELLTYNPSAFIELKDLFDLIKVLFNAGKSETLSLYKSLPSGPKSFIKQEEWSERIDEIKSNTSSGDSFMKRFFGWFNTFMIVKYLNQVHKDIFRKRPVTESAYDLLRLSGLKLPAPDAEKLLRYYRLMEKNRPTVNYSFL
jgi:hypothetical protein